MHLITLTTDFGSSEYVAQMKGVILGIAPQVRIIDITHVIGPQSVIEGAYVLMTTVVHFRKAVHVGVVDPGVGSSRRAVVFECERGILVGPDNGLLVPAAEKLGLRRCYEIKDPKATFISDGYKVSDTFHGRDIFAPVAARLAQGSIKPKAVGPQVRDFVRLDLMDCRVTSKKAKGMILRVDHFGNLVTNLPRTVLKDLPASGTVEVRLGNKRAVARPVRIYSDGRPGELLLLSSSSGLVELARSGARATDKICAHPGDVFELELQPPSKMAPKSRKGKPIK